MKTIVSFLYKYTAWWIPAVIVTVILAMTLIVSHTAVARGGPSGGSGGTPTVGAPPDDTGGPPEGKGEDEGGNNLSFPVIWSDGVVLNLRGEEGNLFEGCNFCEDYCNPDLAESLCPSDEYYNHEGCGKDHWYLQQDADNAWQAENTIRSGNDPLNVDWIDWGDNLEAKDWSLKSVVRVETVLYQDLASPMTGFTMAHLWGQGPDEMWGCNTQQYDSEQATVYSACARLTIQKLADDYANLTWESSTGEWTGDVGGTIYKSGVWQGGHGPDLRTEYSAEINVPGKVIYGHNWNVPRENEGTGYYRITFSLEGEVLITGVSLNTFFTDATQIMPSTEGEEATEEEPGGGGIAVIDHENNLTYIDVYIQDSPGGTSGGQGGGRR